MKKDLRREQGVYAVHVVNEVDDCNYVYVGSGFLGDRVGGNISKLKRNDHGNKHIQEAYNKYGNVKVEVLEICDSEEEARDLENEYVEHYKKLDNTVVCNIYKAYTIRQQYKRKLNENDVIDIQNLLAEGKRNKEIAEKYKVDQSTISRIKSGIRWQSVTGL